MQSTRILQKYKREFNNVSLSDSENTQLHERIEKDNLSGKAKDFQALDVFYKKLAKLQEELRDKRTAQNEAILVAINLKLKNGTHTLQEIHKEVLKRGNEARISSVKMGISRYKKKLEEKHSKENIEPENEILYRGVLELLSGKK